MSREELRSKVVKLDDERKTIEKDLARTRERGSRLRQLEELREFLAFRGPFWEEIAVLDEWTTITTPEGE